MHDLRTMEYDFLNASCSLDDTIEKMLVWLRNSGRRTPEEIEKVYGLLNENERDVSVRESLRRWMLTKYLHQIDGIMVQEST